MTSDDGRIEPVEAGSPAPQHDDLEHWLHDIRTDLTDDGSDWPATGAGAGAEAAGDVEARPAIDSDDPGFRPGGAQTVGRRRAED